MMDLVRSDIISIGVICNATFIGDYIRYARKNTDSFAHNTRLWKYCKGGKNSDCYKSEFLNRFCSMFPFQSMKTVRLRANLIRELLKDDRWYIQENKIKEQEK